MIFTVAWKEYREHRIVWLFMAVAATVLTVLVTQIYPALNIGAQASDTALYLLVAAAGSVLTYGVVCGAMLLAGERESSTQTFLDALTGRRLRIWFAKLFPGVVFCLLQGGFVAGVAALAYPAEAANFIYGGPPLTPLVFFILLPLLALDAFVWGLLASALCSSVLMAAGLAALSWLLAWLLLFPCFAFQNPVLPVLGRARAGRGSWIHVRLPGRPNGHAGWISADHTRRTYTDWRVSIRLSTRRVTVFHRGRVEGRFRAVVGRASTPTPRGHFFVEEAVPLSRLGGPFALAISARSNVYQQFAGGPGQVALHGTTGLTGALGTAVSHGCIRLSRRAITWLARRTGPGVPLTIRS